MALLKLYSVPGSGAMICEAAFALASVEIEHVDLTWDDVGWESEPLHGLNILGQIPTLVFPSGEVLTETNAILHWIHSRAPDANLMPQSDDPQYVQFLRWLMFLNAAVYPTFTYGDVPTRWVEDNKDAATLLQQGTDNHRKLLHKTLEKEIVCPYFLGDRFSVIDLYLWLMTYWRPGKDWFKGQCPKMYALAETVENIPEVADVAKRNFPDS